MVCPVVCCGRVHSANFMAHGCLLTQYKRQYQVQEEEDQEGVENGGKLYLLFISFSTTQWFSITLVNVRVVVLLVLLSY